MTLDQLLAEYERRRLEAEHQQSQAPLARVYALVLEELRRVDVRSEGPRLLRTGEAARRLGLAPKTLANWCGTGRVPGATKSSSDGGTWLIPSTGLSGLTHRPARSRRGLWRGST